MGKFAKKLLGKYAREARITNIEANDDRTANCPFPLKSHMKDGSEQRYCVMTMDALT